MTDDEDSRRLRRVLGPETFPEYHAKVVTDEMPTPPRRFVPVDEALKRVIALKRCGYRPGKGECDCKNAVPLKWSDELDSWISDSKYGGYCPDHAYSCGQYRPGETRTGVKQALATPLVELRGWWETPHVCPDCGVDVEVQTLSTGDKFYGKYCDACGKKHDEENRTAEAAKEAEKRNEREFARRVWLSRGMEEWLRTLKFPARVASCAKDGFEGLQRDGMGSNIGRIADVIFEELTDGQPCVQGWWWWGKAGRGKTHLMACVAVEMARRYPWVTADNVLYFAHREQYDRMISRDPDDRPGFSREMVERYRLILFDEFYQSPTRDGQLFSETTRMWLTGWERSGAIVALGSNASPEIVEEVESRLVLGDAAPSVSRARGMLHVMEVTGPDRRYPGK